MKFFTVLRILPLNTSLLFACLIMLAGPSYAATYYVSKTGSDSSPGTETSPWQTIAKANSTLRAGDTVLIRAGQYKEPIKPTNSGTGDGARITYKNYPGESPLISNTDTAINLDNRAYITADGIHVDGNVPWPSANINRFASILDGHHNTIKNGNFKHANAEGVRTNSSYNKILNNIMDAVGTLNDSTGSSIGEMIYMRSGSEYNLIEGNTLTRGGHNILKVGSSSTSYNVIRNNVFDADWGGGLGYRSVALKSNRNVFEGNVLTGSGDNGKGKEGEAIKVEGTNNIVRFNYLFSNKSTAITSGARDTSSLSAKNRIYNNTVYNNGKAWTVREFNGAETPVADNIFKNNIVYKSRTNSSYEFVLNIITGPVLQDNKIISNCITNSVQGDATINLASISGSTSLTKAQTNHPDNFHSNLQVAPQFVVSNPSRKEDFELSTGSACIDAGDFLTTTTAAGSGKTIPVKDPLYFFDGFGIASGDSIQVGSNAPVRITKVDYSGKVITVDKIISWNNGDGVSLEYTGSAPDIGARESGVSINKLAQPSPPVFL